MEQDAQAPPGEWLPGEDALQQVPTPPHDGSNGSSVVRRIFSGPYGLRAGWSTLLFVIFTVLFIIATAPVVATLTGIGRHGGSAELSPSTALASEIIQVLAILIAGLLMSRIEGRRLQDYFLSDRRRLPHFFAGAVIGFIALSVLVGAMALGGWLRFSSAKLPAAQLAGFGLLWALVFLLTGFFEEGGFRCYLQFTFTRGINFWWAAGIVGALCLDLALRRVGGAAWGVYIVALLGVLPCLWLQTQRTEGAGFWQAAWVTSTLFGFIHITNNGENWVGIFGAAAIGFVFCLSVWVTGSAWWAIGCHAAWDWAETFFYGTADSGLVTRGHFLSAAPAGNVFWSGGTDGPEGSVLILAILVLFIAALLLIYSRRRAVPLPQLLTQPVES